MSWWARSVESARAILGKGREELELDDEIRFHLEMEARELEAGGLSSREARRRARLAFGGVEGVKEKVRDERGGRIVDDFFQDLRLALRTLPRQPLFALAVVLVLAIGIGGNVAMLDLTRSSVLRSLPYPDADRLVLGRVTYDGELGTTVSGPDYFDVREQSTTLSELAALTPFALGVPLTGVPNPERVRSPLVSTNLFRTLGVRPALGRGFEDREGEPEADPVVVLAYDFWRHRLGGDETVLGSSLQLDGVSHTIVGVMPEGFRFYQDTDVWRPLRRGGDFAQARQYHNFVLVGRLAPGVELSGAQAEIDTLTASLAEQYPATNRGKGMRLTPLRAALTEDLRSPLLVLSAAVVLLLLVACANVAGLLIARGSTRRAELAVRSAMGAGRERLARQLVVENGLLALAAAPLAVGFALWLQSGVLSLTSFQVLRSVAPGMSGAVVTLAVALAGFTLLLFGVGPAFKLAATSPAERLRHSGRLTGGRAALASRNRLAVGQVALTAVLLVIAGLLLRSFSQLRSVELGFDAESVLTAEIQLPSADYSDLGRRAQLFAELGRQTEALPGVSSVGLVSRLPVRDPGNDVRVARPEDWESGDSVDRHAYQRMVFPGYFDAMGIPVVAGRDVARTDVRDGANVIVLSRSLSESLFPDEEPLGRTVGIDVGSDDPWLAEVVGVVGDVIPSRLVDGTQHAMYFSYDQRSPSAMRIAVRTEGRLDVLPQLRVLLAELDPNLPLSAPAWLDDIVADSLSERRAFLSLLLAFALVSLLLSAVGLYGLLAYQVSRQSREIGVRLALGASARRVAGAVLSGGLRLVALGVVLGVPLAWLSAQSVRSLLYGVGTLDAVTTAGVVGFLIAVGATASLLPAWRAASIDPSDTIRRE